jgi:hypothetical protein
LTLSSTANAINGFFKGSNSTVGIVPDMSGSQQLLLLLNVPQNLMDNGGASMAYTMKLMYNSKVISFESGAQSLGLDFVGYSTSATAWTISTTTCYQDSAIMCQKYSDTLNAQTNNALNQVNDSSGNSLYGIYTFQCGSSVNTSSLCGASCKD